MLKDINFQRIESIAVAVIPDEKEDGIWKAFLLNQTDFILKTVMVSSKGYGDIDGKLKETATLRWILNDMPPQSFQPIEEIPDELRLLNNEFLISFVINGKLLDKKVIFVPESIQETFYIDVPLLNQKGVLIR